MSVHLCGGWARAEAKPPNSDTDLVVVVDKIDNCTSAALREVWRETNMGCANVVDLPEVAAGQTELRAMMSDFHTLLFGADPLPMPTKVQYAQNLADVASRRGLYARCREYYRWESSETKIRDLQNLNAKDNLKWALQNVVAIRAGEIPRTYEELKGQFEGTEEGKLLDWAEKVTDADYMNEDERLKIARRFSLFVSKWMEESASVQKRKIKNIEPNCKN